MVSVLIVLKGLLLEDSMWFSNWVKRLASIGKIDINISSRTVTINGKKHICKKEPCPICEESTKMVDKSMKMVDSTMEHVDEIMKHVDKIVEEDSK